MVTLFSIIILFCNRILPMLPLANLYSLHTELKVKTEIKQSSYPVTIAIRKYAH